MIHLISLGAGVQSSTMAMMAGEGLIVPMPHAAVFADIQDEPRSVYRWLEEPEEFAEAAVFEGRVQRVCEEVGQARVYLHRSLVPLEAVVFASDGQRDLFGRECEGMCGV